MEKLLSVGALLFLFSSALMAQQGPPIEPCAGMVGDAAVLCHNNAMLQEQEKLKKSLHPVAPANCGKTDGKEKAHCVSQGDNKK